MDKSPEAFRTISEVADELRVPKHVLRFWEAKFAQLKPMKRGRRHVVTTGRKMWRSCAAFAFCFITTVTPLGACRRSCANKAPASSWSSDLSLKRRRGRPRRYPTSPAKSLRTGDSAEPPGLGERAAETDSEGLGAVLKELEDCHRILTSAKG